MKIALIGNMNNNFFSLARFLRDKGIDTSLLLLNNEISHFHPSADSYDLDYMNYTFNLSWGGKEFVRLTKKEIYEDLKDYDVLIGSGYAPSYCFKAGRELDIFFPYGEDIWGYVTYPKPSYIKNLRKLISSLISVPATKFQRDALKHCNIVNMSYTNSIYETQISKYCNYKERWLDPLPMVYTKIYNENLIENFAERTHWYHIFKEIREKSDLMIISQARHVWGGSISDPNQKGNDKLINGYSKFVKSNNSVKSMLVLLEYGPNVQQSKKLIKNLNIEDRICWMPKMYRKDLMIGLALSDIVCDQFAHSWVTCGSTLEPLALGKPLMKYLNAELIDTYNNGLYPLMNANSANEIADYFEDYLSNPEKYIGMGKKGKQWYDNIVVERSIGRYINYITSKKNKNAFK
ncbi:MAG TPA: glycosyltransferase [Oligoflexia bacterium]|nr:glycosyltransferase [Oligoflexia bacterium]HMP48568.1 glycosyltransferase [Oligoflexia bacterium]